MNDILKAANTNIASKRGSLSYHNIDAAEMRRRQLLQTACQIVESEGVEALKPARIGELSGCARTLVYRYFPDRSAILKAIAELFYDQLEEQLADSIITTGAMTATEAEFGAKQFVEALFGISDELGVAAVVLRSTPPIGEEFGSFLEELYLEHEQFMARPLREHCVSDAETRLLLDNAYRIAGSFMVSARRGQISRERAVSVATAAIGSLFGHWTSQDVTLPREATIKEFTRSG